MTVVICPGCARPVPATVVQREGAAALQPPSRAANDFALEVIAAAARSGVFGRHAFHFVGTLRRDLACEVAR